MDLLEARDAGEGQDAATVAEPSFIYFVYPFQFEPEDTEAHVKAIKAATVPTGSTEPDHDQNKPDPRTMWDGSFSFSLDDLMPHVADYLRENRDEPLPKPGTQAKPPLPGYAEKDVNRTRPISTAHVWKLDERVESLFGIGRRAQWTLNAGKQEIPFTLGESGGSRFAFQLILFRVGVGFLTISATPQDRSLATWTDFLHYFRITNGQREVSVRAEKRTGPNQTAPFVPELAVLGQGETQFDCMNQLISGLLESAAIPERDRHWWDDVFVPGRLLVYANLVVMGMPDREEAHLRLLYQLRHFFREGQTLLPAPEDCRRDHPSLLAYTDRQWFVFTQEGGGFVAFDPPRHDFFRVTLPAHLRDQYFLLFLLALHQRSALMRLSAEVAKLWHPAPTPEDYADLAQSFAHTRNALLLFKARSYFMQVMQRESHHRSFAKWQETFQVERLHAEVREEVSEMHDFLALQHATVLKETEERREQDLKKLNLVIGGAATAFGIPSLTLSFLQVNNGLTPNLFPTADSPWLFAASLAVTGVMIWQLISWQKRRDKKDHK